MFILDAHQDLAWNMLTFGRDYTRSAAETRARESGGTTPARNGDTLLGWEEYQRGMVAAVFSTLFVSPKRRVQGEWDTQSYLDTEQAHALYSAQLDAYRRLCDQHPDKFRLIQTRADLASTLAPWEPPVAEGGRPVGLVVLMEGAEGVRHPGELEWWWRRGLRLIGPAWAGTRFCGGTGEPGPLTPEGYALLEGMAAIGFGLDLSHMDARAALQALDAYPGVVLASHSNALALLKGSQSNRHLPDEVIRGLIEHGGVIGINPLNHFLVPGWRRGEERSRVTLHHLVAQIDYICQLAGSVRHVGLGTDFDGGYGVQSVPAEIDTIADVRKIGPLLAEKGYSEADIAAIYGGNWCSLLERVLPEAL